MTKNVACHGFNSRVHPPAHTLTPIHTHTHTYMLGHTHMRMSKYTHSHTHMHTHTERQSKKLWTTTTLKDGPLKIFMSCFNGGLSGGYSAKEKWYKIKNKVPLTVPQPGKLKMRFQYFEHYKLCNFILLAAINNSGLPFLPRFQPLGHRLELCEPRK